MAGGGLVERRTFVYPADVSGRFRAARRALGVALLLFFALAPFLRVGGLPAVRIDIPARRLILLGGIFTPHDTWALALLALVATILLFFFASVFGRVWCGWACPQTVWLDWVYRPVERLVEGRAATRRKLDARGWRAWPASWWARKLGKHGAFLAITAVATGIFLSWFVGGPELLRGEVGRTAVAVGAFLGGLFYLDAAWFREQLCVYACPYARFQGALMSERSLVVAYDAARGEPRKLGKARAGGDCISCDRCVQVCPSGIDIRDGDQLSCVACASCVDACDAVMVQIGKPTGLIRYTTDRDATGVRPVSAAALGRHSVLYIAVLALLVGALVVGMVARPEATVAVARALDGDGMFRRLPDGRVANRLTLHVSNRAAVPHAFTVESASAEVVVAAPGTPWLIGWGQEARHPAFVTAPATAFVAGRLPCTLALVRDDGLRVEATFTLLGPEGLAGGEPAPRRAPEGGGAADGEDGASLAGAGP